MVMDSDDEMTPFLEERCLKCGSSDIRVALSMYNDRYCGDCREYYCKDLVTLKNSIKILKRLLKFEVVKLIHDAKVFVNMDENEHDYDEWWDAQRSDKVSTLECEHCYKEFDSAGERRDHEHTCTGF